MRHGLKLMGVEEHTGGSEPRPVATGDANGAPEGPSIATSRLREDADEGCAHDDDVYRVELDVFEGPLDLLLHLIRKHELDILDIPISFITKKYLAYLDLMKSLHIDVASEYLVMAATLAHMKSKTLLPASGDDDGDEEAEEVDPRAELVRRLLEYQKYKQVADHLGSRATLGRDVFARGGKEPEPEGPAPLAPGNVFRLFDAFEQVLKRADQTADHQVLFERVSISERIVALTELLQERRRLPFVALFEGDDKPNKMTLVVTFLALLEMGKLRVIRVLQDDSLGEIFVEYAPKRIDGDAVPVPEAPSFDGFADDDEAADDAAAADTVTADAVGDEASAADASADDGAAADGVEDDGAEDDGAEDDGAEDDGAEDDGVEDDGVEGDGAEDDGVEGDGVEDDGVEGDGVAAEVSPDAKATPPQDGAMGEGRPVAEPPVENEASHGVSDDDE